jgi:hypothetical protein
VPVLIDDVRPPLGFRSAQTVFLHGWPHDRDGLDALLEGSRCLSTSVAVSMDGPLVGNKRSIAVLPFANLSRIRPGYSAPDWWQTSPATWRISSALCRFEERCLRSKAVGRPSHRRSTGRELRAARQRAQAAIIRLSRRSKKPGRPGPCGPTDTTLLPTRSASDELTREIVTALIGALSAQGLHRRASSAARKPELLYRGLYDTTARPRTLTARSTSRSSSTSS